MAKQSTIANNSGPEKRSSTAQRFVRNRVLRAQLFRQLSPSTAEFTADALSARGLHHNLRRKDAKTKRRSASEHKTATHTILHHTFALHMRFMFYYVNHIVRVHGRYVSRLLLKKALGIASRARHTYGIEPAACVKQQTKTCE